MTLRHLFVENIPEVLEQGVLYVSIPYRTIVHRCACGCGEEVVTPIGPAAWKMTYDGGGVTIAPSIGNRSLPCRSHYWIERSQILWAPRFRSERSPASGTNEKGIPTSGVRDLDAPSSGPNWPVNGGGLREPSPEGRPEPPDSTPATGKRESAGYVLARSVAPDAAGGCGGVSPRGHLTFANLRAILNASARDCPSGMISADYS